jgi:iron complex outermembrane recepter protein
MKIKIYSALTIGLLSFCITTFAQDAEPKKEEDLYDLSLEELMNIPIKSASKKEETLFEAPLSSYTITRSDIDKAGSTSIPEALKMAPGVIVREQANGMYDVHIRGMDNLTRTNGTFFKSNAYTLVMVDNRPVFNHGLGSTNWESLSVDINDVERIEIVRGPSSPLFGPNAVTGVINIITKRLDNSNVMVNASLQAGTLGTTIGNASVGKKFGKFSAIISGNFQNRSRVDSKYYVANAGQYLDLDQYLLQNIPPGRPHIDPTRALEKWGVNGFFDYKASEHVNFDLSISTQSAGFQKIWLTNPLSEGTTENTTANLSAKIYALNFRSSYLKGHTVDLRGNAPYGEFDFSVADAIAEYDYKIGEKYSITPGISYQTVTFDDQDYVNPKKPGVIGLFNASNTITTLAGYLRADLNFTDKLRVLAGLRVDKFSDPNEAYLAYELASTYKINSKNLVRVAITRSNSGSFTGYNFLNIGGGQTGNKNLKLFTLDMIEVGYRAQLSSKLQVDIDVFRQTGNNLTALLSKSLPSPGNPFALPQQFFNLPTTATQLGATISINFVPNERIQFKPFFTVQKTDTKDFPSSYLDPTLSAPGVPTFVKYSDSEHTNTPSSYGGFYFNYRAIDKLNINLSGYYFSSQTQYDGSTIPNPFIPNPNLSQVQAYTQISGKFMMSAKVYYEVTKNLNIFVNARNLFGSASREFYATDQTAGLYTGGLSYNLSK